MVVNSRFARTFNGLNSAMQATDKQHVLLNDEPLRELASRIVSSPLLKRSPRLCELFLYLFEHSVKGNEGAMREQTIGEEVFSRPRGYDTGADNIVRVNVFLLRKKLDQYFAAAGVHEPVVVTIPKGSYVVEFQVRPAEESAALAEPSEAMDATTPVPPQPVRRNRRFVAVACVALAGVALAVWLLLWFLPGRSAQDPAAAQEHYRFWNAVFSPERETYIVLADSGFGLLQDLSGATLNLDDYRAYSTAKVDGPSGALPDELTRRLMERQYTGVSDSSIAFRLGAVSNALKGRAAVRSARSVNVRDLKAHNVILLGSARSNPWVSLLKDQMNFQIEYEPSPPRGFVRNMHPREGEPTVLRATAMGGKPGDAFGLIAFLPNLDESGHIVSIAGTNMEGTEAAAELLLNEHQFKTLTKRLDLASGAAIPYFEAVIRATSVGGAGSAPEIVAARIHGAKE